MTAPRIIQRSLKILVTAAMIIAALVVLAILAAEPIVNSSAFKARLEDTIGDVLDMRFRIEGRIKLGVWPLLTVAADNIYFSTSEGRIASADRIEIDPRLLDLISLKVHLDEVHIQAPQLTFDPHAIDKILALAARRTDGPLPVESLVVESFSISRAKFYYADDRYVVDLGPMNFIGGRLAIIENREVVFIDVISFFQALDISGAVSAQQINSPDIKLTNIEVPVESQNGLLTFDPIELEYLGAGATLRTTLDFSDNKPLIESQVRITGLSIGTLAEKYSPQHRVRGKFNVAANISAGPIEIDQLFKGAPGTRPKDSSASKMIYPVKSLNIDGIKVEATDAAYSKDKTTVEIPRLSLTADRLTIVEESRLRIKDFNSLMASANFKVDAAVKRIFSAGHDIRDVRMNFKVDRGNLIADALQLRYMGSSTKISGRMNLLRQMSDAQLRIETAAPDLKSLVGHMVPEIDFSGGLKVAAVITANDVRLDRLGERMQAIAQSARPVEEVFPVKRVEIKSIDIDVGNLQFKEGITKLDDANISLTSGLINVIENHKLKLKNFETLWRNARFDANVHIGSFSVKDEKFDDIKTFIQGNRGSLKTDLIDLNYFGARTKIAGILDIENNRHRLKVQIEMPGVDTEQFFEGSNAAGKLKGMMNARAEFESRAAVFTEMLGNLNGGFSIRGENVTLIGADLDKALDQFKKMSSYGFSDFSALVLLGPLGTVVSHGYDQLEALDNIMAATGDSTLNQIVSDWNVSAGVMTTRDVAFSTQRNRVAVKGSLDLANTRFNNVVIAVVDPRGCTLNSETINGPFEKPEIEDAGVIKRTVVRPLKRFLNTKCELFYDGAVSHPTENQP